MKACSIDSPVFRALGRQDPKAVFGDLPTPCYVIDEGQLIKNCEILSKVMRDTGCKILLAQKAFSNFAFYKQIGNYLSGTEASGLFEARLGKEEMPDKEVHVFSAAYKEEEFEKILLYADHIVFNSPSQLKKYVRRAKDAGKSIGLRINPEHSTQEGHAIYDPCAKGSRLGTTRDVWDKQMTKELIDCLDGLHFHTLCEQNADALAATLYAAEEKFGDVLCRMKWLNMGGGHHITKEGYDIPLLEETVRYAQKKWNVQVYLEPGEAVALNAGFLLTRVLDIVENGGAQIAVLDASAACHMPDVIEMPYTPPLLDPFAGRKNDCAGGKQNAECGAAEYAESGAEEKIGAAANDTASEKIGAAESGKAEEKHEKRGDGCVYSFGGPTCLSGDMIGSYVLRGQLCVGDLLVFGDMAIYTTCKNNTFNGMPLPNIYMRGKDGQISLLKRFGYEDFKNRLG